MTHTDSPSVANVLAVYNGASADNLRWGMAWYPTAHTDALSVNPRGRGVSRIVKAAGVIAALSPMMNWDSNVAQARIAFREGTAMGLGLDNNCVKATRILYGEHPLDVLGGDKVRAFYNTIVDPRGFDVPVIDRHAFDVAVGEVTDEKRRGILGRKGVYNLFGQAYIDAAKATGISASQMQAITWVTWREAKGIG